MTTSPPSRSLKWPVILNYAIAVVSAATSAVVAFALYPLWGADAAPLLFLPVVMFVALAAGPGPAALTSVLTFLSLQYPLLSSGYPFVLQPGEILRLGLFVVASVFVLMLSAHPEKNFGLASTATQQPADNDPGIAAAKRQVARRECRTRRGRNKSARSRTGDSTDRSTRCRH